MNRQQLLTSWLKLVQQERKEQSEKVYQFPVAALKNHHKLKWLKTRKIQCLSALEFRSLKWSEELFSFWRFQRRLFPCLFQLLEAPNSLACDLSCIFKANSVASSVLPEFLPPSYKDPSNYLGPTWITQDNPYISTSLIMFMKFLLNVRQYIPRPQALGCGHI